MPYKDLSGNNPTTTILDKAVKSTSPAVSTGAPVDPNAADIDFDRIARGFYVGASGNLTIVDPTGNTRLLTGLVVGSIIDIQLIGTRADSTTVVLINPLY